MRVRYVRKLVFSNDSIQLYCFGNSSSESEERLRFRANLVAFSSLVCWRRLSAIASVRAFESDCPACGVLAHACSASRTLTASKYSWILSSAGSHFSRIVSGSFLSCHDFVMPWLSSISNVDCTITGSALRPTCVVNKYSIVSLSVYWVGCSCSWLVTAASALEFILTGTLARCHTRVGTVTSTARAKRLEPH